MSFGCVFLGSLAPRLPLAPSCDTGGVEGSGGSCCLLLSVSYRLPLSLACEAGWAGLMLVPMSVGRFRPAVCDARFLWIAFLTVAMAASPCYLCIVS